MRSLSSLGHYASAVLLLVHGLIHGLGFAKAFGRPVPLEQAISRASGMLWLACALSFVASALLLMLGASLWWLPAAPALVVSQLLIVAAWNDAKFGTLANVVILAGVALAVLDGVGATPRANYQREVEQRLERAPTTHAVVTVADLARLPQAVRRYLEVAGTVGRERVANFHATFRGEIRKSPDADWMRFEADQHSFFADRARLFLLRASQVGVPFDALHLYLGPNATMQVTVASVLRVVDARGAEMNQSETVTMFNDMCLLAPATLIDPSIVWQELDPSTVRGTFTNAGNTISAVLSFDASGRLVNFTSDDRYLSADGQRYERYRWSTPIAEYGDFSGRRAFRRGEASWSLPGGEFAYARLEVLKIEYNVGACASPLNRSHAPCR